MGTVLCLDYTHYSTHPLYEQKGRYMFHHARNIPERISPTLVSPCSLTPCDISIGLSSRSSRHFENTLHVIFVLNIGLHAARHTWLLSVSTCERWPQMSSAFPRENGITLAFVREENRVPRGGFIDFLSLERWQILKIVREVLKIYIKWWRKPLNIFNWFLDDPMLPNQKCHLRIFIALAQQASSAEHTKWEEKGESVNGRENVLYLRRPRPLRYIVL